MNTIVPGSILVATPRLLDRNFRRSVILVCDHDEHGSLGLILNRPLEIPLSEVLSTLAPEDGGSRWIHLGGPVETGRLLAVRRGRMGGEPVVELTGGLNFPKDLECTVDLLKNGSVDSRDYFFFLGYAGWGSSQLVEEMKEGSWVVSEGDANLLFENKASEMWSTALRRLGGGYALWAEMPLDPDLN